ncbi:hypothetical protein CDL15_Pgr026693 [Punica granatum]|uniref:Uncharacterized protein n=1 Tax=Punica granatum TaxID=22663 RepID=A0A218WL84_PUNGR|nr:hypothetical protein CDL15_Pgr026693 [Punica granatum]PKI40304.1 hypothetical protein CRG98_039329 [Punica granatum]
MWCSHCLIRCVPDITAGTKSCPECGKILGYVKVRKISKRQKKPMPKRIKNKTTAQIVAEDGKNHPA